MGRSALFKTTPRDTIRGLNERLENPMKVERDDFGVTHVGTYNFMEAVQGHDFVTGPLYLAAGVDVRLEIKVSNSQLTRPAQKVYRVYVRCAVDKTAETPAHTWFAPMEFRSKDQMYAVLPNLLRITENPVKCTVEQANFEQPWSPNDQHIGQVFEGGGEDV